MSAPAPIDVLTLRAWARGYLWWAGLIDTIPEAIDPLAQFAERVGLDQDATQQILADAFAPYREAAQ
jgi:hypothetical protein